MDGTMNLSGPLRSPRDVVMTPRSSTLPGGGLQSQAAKSMLETMVIPAMERKLRKLKKQSRRSKRQVAQLEEELGEQYFSTGQYEKGKEVLLDAITIYIGIEDVKSEGYASSCLANCHFKLREFPQARERYTRSLECAKELEDVVVELQNTYNIALCDSRMGKWTEATGGIDKALKLTQCVEPEAAPPLAAPVICAAAFIKQSQAVYRDAVGRYREGLATFSNDAPLAFFALTNLGICFDKLGQLDNAKKEFTEALDIAMTHQLPLRDQLRALYHMAMVQLQLGQHQAALDKLHEAEQVEALLSAHQQAEETALLARTIAEPGQIKRGQSTKAVQAPPVPVAKRTSSLDPSCSFLRASLSTYLAQLTLLCETRVAHTVHPVLDRVLELCDAATEEMSTPQDGLTGKGRGKGKNGEEKELGGTVRMVANIGKGAAHPLIAAMTLNMRAILQAIEGEAEEALILMGQMRKLLDEHKVEPPPAPSSFLPEVWAAEAVNFPLNAQEVLTHGPARNVRMFLRHGMGLGSMGEAGMDNAGDAKTIKKTLTAIKATSTGNGSAAVAFPYGRDPSDACVSELQMAYCLQVLSEEANGNGKNGRRRSSAGTAEGKGRRKASESSVSAGAGEGRAGDGVRASLENALMSAKQKNDKVMIAASLRCLSDLSREENDIYAELQFLKQHEKIVRDFKDQGWYADCCRRLISIYTRLSKMPPPKADKHKHRHGKSPAGEKDRRRSNGSRPNSPGSQEAEGGQSSQPTSPGRDEEEGARSEKGEQKEGGDGISVTSSVATSALSMSVASQAPGAEGEGEQKGEGKAEGGRERGNAGLEATMGVLVNAAATTMGERPRRAGMLLLQSNVARMGGKLTYEEIEQRGEGGPGDEAWVHEHGKDLAHFYLQMYKELQGRLGWYLSFRS